MDHPLLILPNLLFTLIAPNDAASDQQTPWQILDFAVFVVGWGSIAVLWHWRILRAASYTQAPVTFDRRIWSYIWRSLILGLIVGCIAAAIMIPSAMLGFAIGPESPPILAYLGLSLAIIIIGIVMARLSLVLPAIALDRPSFGLKEAWDVTEGNAVRLLLVTLLPMLPLYLLLWLLQAMSIDSASYGFSFFPFLSKAILTVIDVLVGMIGLTVLSITLSLLR